LSVKQQLIAHKIMRNTLFSWIPFLNTEPAKFKN
jgi:hypothetical protein